MLARQASTDGSRAKLGGENVDRRVGEIADSSRVVEIEMGRHDVTYVAWTVAEIHDLPQRRLSDLEPRPRHRVEQQSEPSWLVDILDPEPGVDQDQSVVALDQKAMAAHGRGRQRPAGAAEQSPAARAERPAVEVMDTHARSSNRSQPVTDLSSASTYGNRGVVQSKAASMTQLIRSALSRRVLTNRFLNQFGFVGLAAAGGVIAALCRFALAGWARGREQILA
jgi:hypothetical protein